MIATQSRRHKPSKLKLRRLQAFVVVEPHVPVTSMFASLNANKKEKSSNDNDDVKEEQTNIEVFKSVQSMADFVSSSSLPPPPSKPLSSSAPTCLRGRHVVVDDIPVIRVAAAAAEAAEAAAAAAATTTKSEELQHHEDICNESIEECPICQYPFVGLTFSQRTIHVHGCLYSDECSEEYELHNISLESASSLRGMTKLDTRLAHVHHCLYDSDCVDPRSEVTSTRLRRRLSSSPLFEEPSEIEGAVGHVERVELKQNMQIASLLRNMKKKKQQHGRATTKRKICAYERWANCPLATLSPAERHDHFVRCKEIMESEARFFQFTAEAASSISHDNRKDREVASLVKLSASSQENSNNFLANDVLPRSS